MRYSFVLLLIIGFFCGWEVNASSSLKEEVSENSLVLDIGIADLNNKGVTYKQIAKKISENYQGDSLRIRAIFMWVAGNIHYDVKNMNHPKTYQSAEQMVEEVLKTRKGVCIHYAELFSKIANEMGIKTYVISGYTIQNGKIDNIAHAWCGSLIENQWYLFDPTWGGGHLENNKYKKIIDEYYCQMSPDSSIQSHFPFDPLWQFRNANGFSYLDSLQKYEESTEIEQLEGENYRIIQNGGGTNKLIKDRLSYNLNKIKTIQNNIAIDTFNESVIAYNQAIELLNQWVKDSNQKLSESEQQSRKNQIKTLLEGTQEKIIGIKVGNPEMDKSVKQLSKSIKQALSNLQRLMKN